MKKMTLIALVLLSTTALADTHNEKKQPPDDMKKPEPPKAPAATMTQPKPPPEIAAMHKGMTGNWKCNGKGIMDPAKPTELSDFKGTMKATLDLDNFWIRGEWNGTSGKLKMRGIMYMTFDPASKKWHRIMVDNWGMSGQETSAGLPAGAKEGKVVWEGESRFMGMTMKGRTTEEVAAKSMKMTAEMSMDGKKWITGMEMTCTK